MTEFRTANDLVYEVAGILGKAVAGESLDPVAYDTIDSAIDPVLAEVSDIVVFGDRDELPTRYFQTLARLVAVHAASKFSNVPVDLNAVDQHENRLRFLAAQAPSYEPLRAEYY
jgi:hypothetical protein